MLMVDRWPEDDNCQTPEIDAIAGPYAIEHTTVDTVADQRRRDDWYLQVVGGLDRVISNCVDCGFTITLEYDAIEKGMDWNFIRADLKNWILSNAFNLSHWIASNHSSDIDFRCLSNSDACLERTISPYWVRTLRARRRYPSYARQTSARQEGQEATELPDTKRDDHSIN